MIAKKSILWALISYVVLTSLHRLMDGMPTNNIDLFLFVDKVQDVQWYVKDTLDMIGFSIIILALRKVAPPSTRFATNVFFINSIIQVPLYYICYLRYDIFVNFAVIIIILLKIRYDEKNVNYK